MKYLKHWWVRRAYPEAPEHSQEPVGLVDASDSGSLDRAGIPQHFEEREGEVGTEGDHDEGEVQFVPVVAEVAEDAEGHELHGELDDVDDHEVVVDGVVDRLAVLVRVDEADDHHHRVQHNDD